MDSSDGGTDMTDCSAGSIVWVRRRNGSWWPGKILGPDELSVSHLMSPRSGTPVKLLGREDASVDWYNLEKSKRVKAFRCGEFDECIERAEASQGMPPKKREKYARREDAILHALELEKQLLEKKYGNLGSSFTVESSKVTDVEGERTIYSEQLRYGDEKRTRSKSHQMSLVHDDSGALPRMRGLQDFGLRTSTPMVEEQALLACQAKRSGSAQQTEVIVEVMDNRKTNSTLMETSVSEFGENNHSQHAGLNGENTSGSAEDIEIDSSETDSLESDTDEEMTSLSEDAASIELEPKCFGGSEEPEHRYMGAEDFHDPAFADAVSQSGLNEPSSATIGMSKWQHKGKRKSRHFVKRSTHEGNKKVQRGFTCGTKVEEKENDHLKPQMIGYGRGGDGSKHITDWEDSAWNDQAAMKGYWVDAGDRLDPLLVDHHHHHYHHQFGGRMKSILVDVDVKVKTSYTRERVPIISLMSKLNGQAIVGHPIQIEPLENGSTEALLASAHEFSTVTLDKDTTLSPVWRTARRTANFRVPRPHLSTTMDGGDEIGKRPQYAHQDRKPSFRKSNAGGSTHRTMMARKSLPRSADKKTRKPPKKISLSSSQKIRTLSSIPCLNMSINMKHTGSTYHQVDGLIKPESVPTAVVACIPVKLVFCRLNEALFGHH